MTRSTTRSAGLSGETFVEKDRFSLLPNEIILEIAGKIQAVGDLKSLSLSSRRVSTTARLSMIRRDPQRALIHFTACGDIKGIKLALSARADVDTLYEPNGNERSKLLGEHGISNVRKYRPLHIAVIKGDLGTAKYLLEQEATIDAEIDDNITAFWLAVMAGSTSMMRFLANQGCDINQEDRTSSTPLHYCSREGKRKAVQCLLELGADIHAQELKLNLDTPLGVAAQKGKTSICQMLTEKGSDINYQNVSGCTPLHMAAMEGHEAVVKYLLDNGADVDRTEGSGNTALLCAVHRCHPKVWRLLHKTGGSDINHTTSSGETALHIAANFGNLQLIRYLLEHNADVLKQDRDGNTALGLAAKNAGRACLHLSQSDKALLGYVRDATSCRQIYELLQEKGSDVTHKNHDGYTPVQLYDRAQQAYKMYVEDLRASERRNNRQGCSVM